MFNIDQKLSVTNYMLLCALPVSQQVIGLSHIIDNIGLLASDFFKIIAAGGTVDAQHKAVDEAIISLKKRIKPTVQFNYTNEMIKEDRSSVEASINVKMQERSNRRRNDPHYSEDAITDYVQHDLVEITRNEWSIAYNKRANEEQQQIDAYNQLIYDQIHQLPSKANPSRRIRYIAFGIFIMTPIISSLILCPLALCEMYWRGQFDRS